MSNGFFSVSALGAIIVNYLKTEHSLEHIDIKEEWRGRFKGPLPKTSVRVGLSSVTSSPDTVNSYRGMGSGGEIHALPCGVTVSVNLYEPTYEMQTADNCAAIVDALMSPAFGFRVLSAEISDSVFDKTTGCFLKKINFEFKFLLKISAE